MTALPTIPNINPSDISSCAFWLAADQLAGRDNNTTTGQPFTSLTDYFGETLTLPSGGTGPILVTGDGGFKALRFNPNFVQSSSGFCMSSSSLSIPVATAAMFLVIKQHCGSSSNSIGQQTYPFTLLNSGQTNTLLGMTGETSNVLTFYYAGSGGPVYSSGGGANVPWNHRSIWSLINIGGTTVVGVDENQSYPTTNATTGNTAGVGINCYSAASQFSSGSSGSFDIFEAIILNNPSATDIYQIRNYLNAKFQMPVVPKRLDLPLIIVDGNSVANGQQSSSDSTRWLSQAVKQLNVPVEIAILAHSGQTTPFNTNYFPIFTAPLYDPQRKLTIILEWEVINDMASNGASPATAWADTLAYYTQARQMCPNAKLIIPTIQPSGEISDANRVAYNAYVYANWNVINVTTGFPNADVLWDLAANPVIGQNGQNKPPYYNGANGTHFLDPGSAVAGTSFATLLNQTFFQYPSAVSPF